MGLLTLLDVKGVTVVPDGCAGVGAQSTYTGVYKKGGPSTVEPSKDLSSLLDRSPADVRGIKKSVAAQQERSPLASSAAAAAAGDAPAAAGNAPRRPPAINTTSLSTAAHGSGRCAARAVPLLLPHVIARQKVASLPITCI